MAERTFFLEFQMAPGDVSMLTSLVRDIKLTYGDRYRVNVGTNFNAIWRHNPHVDLNVVPKAKGVEIIKMKYDIKYQQTCHIHFVRTFHRYFELKTHIHVPLLEPKADYHFSEEEKKSPIISGRYWLVIAGGKTDITCKWYSIADLQEVVTRLTAWGVNFVQEGSVKKLCVHPPLDNVFNVVGATSVRDLMVNILHADGIICPVTFPMHAAAAVDTPCVVLAGGREEAYWEAYDNTQPEKFGPKCSPVKVPHRYLHTIGQLKCCQTRGCWKQRVVALPDRAKHNSLLCHMPIKLADGQFVPKCLDLLTPDIVIEAVMSYFEDGTLSPPSQLKTNDRPDSKT